MIATVGGVTTITITMAEVIIVAIKRVAARKTAVVNLSFLLQKMINPFFSSPKTKFSIAFLMIMIVRHFFKFTLLP